MVFELHIWGPGFGLPSIDPACLATIALFRECLQIDDWVLIPAADPTISALGELPALKDGELWIAGFQNIATYLENVADGKWRLGGDLNQQQAADCTAYLSFIESRGLPLLDLLLYVSSENYNACTKPALGNILSWPQSWVLPGRLRAKAKKRSEHLGLSSLDVDTIDEDKSKDTGLTAHIPVSLRKPKLTVSSILGRDMRRNKFRLNTVNADFLEPLDEALGQQEWLFGDRPSSTDCLAIAVLTLMYMPTGLPHSWLKSTIDAKHPRLAKWVKQHAAAWFGAHDQQKTSSSSLPWRAPHPRDWQEVLSAVATAAMDSLPVLRSPFSTYSVERDSANSHTKRQHQKQVQLLRLRQQHLLYSQLLLSTLATTTMAGILIWKGYLNLPRRPPRPRNFGQAGNILGLS